MTSTLIAPEATITASDVEEDHYYCRKCWPLPDIFVRSYCGIDGPEDGDELDEDLEFEATCVVCRDFDGCPVCGHIEP